MPDFEIKGDPGGIRSRARAMVKKADLFSGTGSALRDLDTKKGWYGRSAERFGTESPPRMGSIRRRDAHL